MTKKQMKAATYTKDQIRCMNLLYNSHPQFLSHTNFLTYDPAHTIIKALIYYSNGVKSQLLSKSRNSKAPSTQTHWV